MLIKIKRTRPGWPNVCNIKLFCCVELLLEVSLHSFHSTSFLVNLSYIGYYIHGIQLSKQIPEQTFRQISIFELLRKAVNAAKI